VRFQQFYDGLGARQRSALPRDCLAHTVTTLPFIVSQ